MPATENNSDGTNLTSRIADPVIDIGGKLNDALQNPRVLERIPGRSVSIAALGILMVAILLDIFPAVYGVGLWWSLFFIAGGFAVACQELRGTHTPFGRVRLSELLMHPLLPPAFTVFVAIHAFQLFSFSLLSILWTVAAGLLIWDQWRKSILAPNSFGRFFDARQLGSGYRLNVLIGVMICLASLFLKWGETSPRFFSFWSGGMQWGTQYNYYSRSMEYGMHYNPMLYLNPMYFPGFEFTGRNMTFVIWAELALLSLVVWAAYRGGRGVVPIALATGITVWWALHLANYPGVWLFLVGLLLVNSGVWFLSQQKETGRWAVAGLWQRLRPKSSPEKSTP